MPRINPALYSDAPSPRTVAPSKVLVDPATLGRVQRAMSGQCHECRGGKRKSMSGAMVTCELCGGTGRREAYGLAQISNAAGISTAKTIDALKELKARGVVSRVSFDGHDLWRLVRR